MDFEARGARRVPAEDLVAFKMFDEKGRVALAGMFKTLDISRTGMAAESTQPLTVGAKIELTLGVGQEVVRTVGHVKNQKKLGAAAYHVGIAFDFLTEEDLNKIGMLYPSVLK